MVPDESGAGVTGTEGQGTPVVSAPTLTSSSLSQGEIHDRATYGPDMEVEDLVTTEVVVPNPAGEAAREKLGLSGPEPPRRMLRARRTAGGGVRAAEPACADAQHAGPGPGPTN